MPMACGASSGRHPPNSICPGRMEERAEIGAAFLCADLGITPETRDDHAAYIASWTNVLKDDKRAIFTAASHGAEGRRLSARLAVAGGAIMSRAPFILIDGRLYRWKDILELRRAQLAAAGAAQASQLALFATFHDDRRPPAERTAPGAICNQVCSKIRISI